MNLLDEYRILAEQSQVKIVEDTERGLYCVSYAHAGVDFNNPLVLTARGLVLDTDGNVIVRGFDKFFNYLQFDSSSPVSDKYSIEYKDMFTNGFSTDRKYEFYEKLDGTMVNVSYSKKYGLVVSTKSTCKKSSEYVSIATKLLENNLEFMQAVKSFDETFVFEYVAPTNQIVIPYFDTELVLLGMVTKEGEVLSRTLVDEINARFGFTRPKVEEYTLDNVIQQMETRQDIEGFVVINKYGRLVKFKTQFWFDKHYRYDLFFGGLTRKKVSTLVRMYYENKLDDLYSQQNRHALYKDINIVGRVEALIVEFESSLKNALETTQGYTNKEVASCKDIDETMRKVVLLHRCHNTNSLNKMISNFVWDELSK